MINSERTLFKKELTKIKENGREFSGLNGIDVIDIEGQEGWEEGIVVKNCSDLTELNFSSCDLKKITIQNCPKLKQIHGHNNQLKSLNLSEFPELEEVSVPFNKQMTDLEISECPNIHSIFCFNNNLSRLPNLQQFKNLKKLHCYKNQNLSLLICGNLNRLEEVSAQECNINITNFRKCESLRILDLAENQIKNLVIQDCVNLEQFSARDNLLKDIDLNNNKKLVFLALYNNFFPPTDISKFSHLTNIKTLLIGFYLPNDQKSEDEKNAQRLFKYSDWNRWYGSLEAFKGMQRLLELCIEATDIDRGQEFLPKSLKYLHCSTSEELFEALREEIEKNEGIKIEQESRKCKVIYDWWEEQKKKKTTTSKNSSDEVPEPETSITGWKNKGRKETQACDYEPPANKDKIRHLDLSHWRLKGDLVIENFPRLEFLSVGNNKLTSLTVRNCPNLEVLIYSHNKMRELATIERCDNLKEIRNEKYNDGSWDEHMDSEEIEKEEKRVEGDKAKQKLVNQAYSLIKRTQKGEKFPFQEFLNLFQGKSISTVFNLLEEELDKEFETIFTQKLEIHIIGLINNYSESKRSEFLTEVENLTRFFYLLSPETKQKLTQVVKQENTETIIKNSWPWILSWLGLSLVIIGLMFLLTNKIVKIIMAIIYNFTPTKKNSK